MDLPLVDTPLGTAERFSIPLLAELIPDGISPGTGLLVEYDPNSQWLAVATTAAARWLQTGNRASCATMVRPREAAVKDLERLCVDVAAKEEYFEWTTGTQQP